jgi:hypothetical protein
VFIAVRVGAAAWSRECITSAPPKPAVAAASTASATQMAAGTERNELVREFKDSLGTAGSPQTATIPYTVERHAADVRT